MKFTYDPRYNVGYIRFKNKKADAESIKLSDELVIDLAPDVLITKDFMGPAQVIYKERT